MYIFEFCREAFTQLYILIKSFYIITAWNFTNMQSCLSLSLSPFRMHISSSSHSHWAHPWTSFSTEVLPPKARSWRWSSAPPCALLVGVTRGEIAQGNHQNSYLIQVALEDPFRVLKLFPMWFTYARIVPRNFSLIIRKYNRLFNHFSLISGTSRNPGQVDDLTQLGWMAQASRAMVP